MRLPPLAAAIAAFALAGGVSAIAARTAVVVIEDVSVEQVRDALAAQGHDWAKVQADGLQVILEGAAPTEAVRFRAISAASGIVDASRVIDNMQVVEAETPPPPDFAIEILRNDSGVSLIGLIPAATDRAALIEMVEEAAGGLPVSDLLDVSDHPVPEKWPAALRYAGARFRHCRIPSSRCGPAGSASKRSPTAPRRSASSKPSWRGSSQTRCGSRSGSARRAR
ncbi:BON domain-containing protein [Limimaricola cinnabarinus]|uniref:BON domain-containing protein n=1 Tax=Limimaricola cinnabarinus TaxID=1125964 RepID=UPI0003FB64E7|nr:BON domain-containing protein [Limimaricola cinnabarinus]